MISKTAGIEACCFFMHKIQENAFNREEEKSRGILYIYGFQAEKQKIRKLNFKNYYEYLLT